MMASHRPAETPAAPPPDPIAPDSAAPASTGRTTLAPSNFLIGFDWVLAFGVLALGFLVASFAVRNADFWMHLATGRLLAEGKYHLGTDPFSYVEEGRTWINHSWLFDWLIYQLFKSAGGPGLVIAKALAVAATGGLLLVARKPGQPILPSVICVGLALVASAPRFLLQPTVATFLFLAALLCLVIRMPRRPGSWLFPGLVAGLFWVWANCDQWFFLGPLLLLLFTAGQYIRSDESEHIPSLWKALGLGVLACMLNPHHVHVWTMPPELADRALAEVFAKDSEFAFLFRRGTLDLSGDRDNPANTYSILTLAVLTLVGFGVNYRKASAGLALIWVAVVGLAIYHARAIPFLALVSAPVAAVNLAAAVRRLADAPMSDGTLRTLHALRSGGRFACGIAGIILIAMSYPGWLNTMQQQRRWKWDIEPNPSLERAAKKIHEWRTSGALPPEARMLNLQPDFANYVHWYAPGEKTFFDFRIGFHRTEAADYAALRRQLSRRDLRDKKIESFNAAEFLTKHRITFAVSAHPDRDENRVTLANLWADDGDAGADPEWAFWDGQGRAVVVGWTHQQTIPTAAFERMRFNPARTAYVDPPLIAGPTQPLQPPNPPADIWERFLVSPPVAPVDAEEALVLMWYRQSLLNRASRRHRDVLEQIQLATETRLMTPALNFWAFYQRRELPVPVPHEVTAVALLAVRAARRAILASPDHPDGYFALARAYGDAAFSSTADMREVVNTVSLARARARIANDPVERRATFLETELLEMLYGSHMSARPLRLDLGLETLRLWIAYYRRDLDIDTANVERLSADMRDKQQTILDARRKQLTAMEAKAGELEAAKKEGMERYVIAAAQQASALDRAAIARRFGFYREAIAELRKAQEEFQKLVDEKKDRDLSPSDLATAIAVHAELIELLWYDGKFEEAALILGTLDTPDNLQVMEGNAVRDGYYRARQRAMGFMFQGARQAPPNNPYDADPAAHFRSLRLAYSLAAGDFENATEGNTRDAQLLRTRLNDFRRKNFPISTPAAIPPVTTFERMIDRYYRPLFSPLAPVPALLGGFGRAMHIQTVEELMQIVRIYAEQQVRIGLVYLEQGDVKNAIHYFHQAQDTPELASLLPTQRIAREYLKAIERETGAKGAGK